MFYVREKFWVVKNVCSCNPDTSMVFVYTLVLIAVSCYTKEIKGEEKL